MKADGHYVYVIESPRRHVTFAGTWMIEAPRSKTDSTHIVLRNAPQSCDMVDFFNDVADNTPDPVWSGAIRS